MAIVDTHAHIYSPDEKRYPVIAKPLRVPDGKGSLEDLRAAMNADRGARPKLTLLPFLVLTLLLSMLRQPSGRKTTVALAGVLTLINHAPKP